MPTTLKFTFECLIGWLSEPSHQITWLFVTSTPRDWQGEGPREAWARAGVGAVVEPSTGERQTRKARRTHRQSHPQAADRQAHSVYSVCVCVYRQGLCTSDAIAKSQNAFLTFRA